MGHHKAEGTTPVTKLYVMNPAVIHTFRGPDTQNWFPMRYCLYRQSPLVVAFGGMDMHVSQKTDLNGIFNLQNSSTGGVHDRGLIIEPNVGRVLCHTL